MSSRSKIKQEKIANLMLVEEQKPLPYIRCVCQLTVKLK
jgi:hypothetical protein